MWAQSMGKRSPEQEIQSHKGPDAKGHFLKHIPAGELNQSKTKKKDMSLGNWLVKEWKGGRGGDIVFWKIKENNKTKGL